MPDTATPPRLVDLHTDWLLQYATETTVFDPEIYAGVAARWSQSEGYLQGTRAAVLSCFRRAEDWARQTDPWSALGDLLARIEAEFAGRLLLDADDHQRFLDDSQGLCWGVIGVEGFDALVRGPADLERLPGLFERGVRLFQPVYTSAGALGGSSAPGDDRGLTDLGRAFLETLSHVGAEPGSPRALVDLAHLNPAAAADVLGWFEADANRLARLIPVYSHGAPIHEGFTTPRAITQENLSRLRALGGVIGFSVGPPFFESADQIQAAIESSFAIPFEGRPGPEGIAIGTDFLGVDRTLPGLGNVAEVVAWLASAFEPAAALALIHGNGQALLARMLAARGT